VVFGASFSNHTGIDELKDIIQIDFDRMALGKFHPVTVPVWGDAAESARMIAELISAENHCRDQTDEIARRYVAGGEGQTSRQKRRRRV
jgi:thiamine pyrophosphate-dependent acetolactate synthase large subunit-like protein